MKKNICGLICILFHFIGTGQSKTIDFEIRRKNDKSVDIVYKKNKVGSYTVILEFSNLRNARATGYKGNFFNEKFVGVVNGSGGIVLTLRPEDKEKHVRFDSYRHTYIRGVYNPKVDEDYVYTLPFKKGKMISARETSNLSNKYFSAELPQNWKSFVFKTKETDTVVAARKGIVIKVEKGYKMDTISNFTSKTNYVIIEHKDGTIARYSGFSKNGVFVREGQKVYPQSFLGVFNSKNKKGNTSLIHFNVSYLTNIKIDENLKKKLKDKKSRSTFLNPNFLTTDGILKLKNKQRYTVDITEDIFLSEFTRREKKKYKKGVIKMNN